MQDEHKLKSWDKPETLDRPWRPVGAKMRRAVARLNELGGDIVDYFQGSDIRTIVEPRTDGYVVDVFLVIVRYPSLDLSVTVGEILHNLRSALNIALFTMWEHAPDKADFPIHVEEAKFEREWVRRWKAPEPIADLLRSLQPFNHPSPELAANNSLEILRDLNNTDKHRGLTLLPVGIGRQLEPVMLAEPEGMIRHVVRHLPLGNLKRRTHAYEVHLRVAHQVPDIGIRLQGMPMALENYFTAADTLVSIVKSVEYALTAMHAHSSGGGEDAA